MTWSDPAFGAVAQLVNTRTGLHFPPSRHDSAELGIRRAMAQARVADLKTYRALLLNSPAAFDALIGELTVGETYFFREPAQFEFIRAEVLPEIRRRRGPESVIRAWSAACASGEEAYSLAILFDQEGLGDRAKILATDVSRPALARAQLAAYTNWSLRGEGASAAKLYLTRYGDRHVLDDKIRRRVVLEHLNLAQDIYPSAATNTEGMDLILCRNVLIYLDPETVRKAASRLFESLAPGGWLFTASADPPLRVDLPMEAVVTGAGVFYRRALGERQGDKETRRQGEEPIILSLYPPVADAPGSPRSCMLLEPDRGTLVADARGSAGPVADARGSAGPVADAKGSAGPVADARGSDQALTEARAALGCGDYARAAALTSELLTDIPTALLHVRALANLDSGRAEGACTAAVERQPLSTELHYLHAVLLLDLGRDQEATAALRRVLYLDRSLAIAHFTLGSLLKQQGDLPGARRAYRNARELGAALPAEEMLALSDGEQAGRLVEAATFQLAILDTTRETTP